MEEKKKSLPFDRNWKALEFPDIVQSFSPGTKTYKAIQWAYNEGLTKGMEDGTFGYGNRCTRGQTVTFLYKYSNYTNGKNTQ